MQQIDSETKSVKTSISVAAALTFLFFVSLFLQLRHIENVEAMTDDYRMIESALFVTDGIPHIFGAGYGMTPTWLWAAVLNAELYVPYTGYLAANLLQGRFYEVGRLIQIRKSGMVADLRPALCLLRIINAVVTAAGMIFFSFLIGRRLCESNCAGVAAAAISSVAPIAARLGAHFHPDQYQAVCAAGCIYFCLPENGKYSERRMIIAAVFCAAAIAAKFIAATFFAPILLSVYLTNRNERKIEIVKAAFKIVAAGLIAYALINPYSYTFPTQFIKWIGFRLNDYYPHEYREFEIMGNALFFLKQAATRFGYGFFAMAAAGMLIGLYKRNTNALLLFTAVATYWLLLFSSSAKSHFFRYSFSVLVPLAAFAAYGIFSAARNISPPWRYPVFFALSIACLTPLSSSLAAVRSRDALDIKTEASKWVAQNIPAGSQVFTEYFPPIINYDRNSIEIWKKIYGNLSINGRKRAMPFEFFRDAIFHEERFMHKRFCYLSQAENLPAPGYHLMDLIYIPNDPSLVPDRGTFWAVLPRGYIKSHNRTKFERKLLLTVKQKGKRIKIIAKKGKVGDAIFIFKVEQ